MKQTLTSNTSNTSKKRCDARALAKQAAVAAKQRTLERTRAKRRAGKRDAVSHA